MISFSLFPKDSISIKSQELKLPCLPIFPLPPPLPNTARLKHANHSFKITISYPKIYQLIIYPSKNIYFLIHKANHNFPTEQSIFR
jgi:hypothetical protein